MENKIFMGLGIITIISGIGLILMKQYIPGIGGSIVGIWLTFDNFNKVKANKNQ